MNKQNIPLKQALWVIIFIYFFQGLIHNIGHPITPAFITKDLQIPEYMFGVFFATMAFGLVIGAPIWGVIADRGYKRIAMVSGLVLYSVGQFAFGYVGNMYWMVFFRFLSGFGVSASVTLFISHTVEISDPKFRARNLAWMAATLALGRSVGYWVGGFLTSNAWAVSLLGTTETQLERVFLIQAILNTMHAFVVFFVIKEVKLERKEAKRTNAFKSILNIKKIDPTMTIFLFSLVFMSIAFTNLSKYLDVYFNTLEYSTKFIGDYNLVIGIVGIFTSIIIVPLIIKIQKNLIVLLTIQSASILTVLYVFRANNFILMIYTVFMIYIIGHAIYQPLEQNFIADQVKDGLYSTTMGIRQSFFSIGMVIGPLIGGWLYDLKPIYVFDFSAIMIFIGLILVFIVFIRIKNQKESIS